MDRRDKIAAGVIGALGGILAGATAYVILNRVIDAKLEAGGRSLLTQGGNELERQMLATLDREVPPRVRSELESTLRSYGITPETGARLDRLLAAADRIGLI